MYMYAITINKQHNKYVGDDNDDLIGRMMSLNEVSKKIFDDFKNIYYLELVLHKNDISDYHYHGLLICENEIITLLAKGHFHIENLLNLPKYQKYMHNHDVIISQKWGEIPYYEKNDKENAYDEMLRYYFSSKSAKKTVQRFGIIALKYYRQLKDMEQDIYDE